MKGRKMVSDEKKKTREEFGDQKFWKSVEDLRPQTICSAPLIALMIAYRLLRISFSVEGIAPSMKLNKINYGILLVSHTIKHYLLNIISGIPTKHLEPVE